MKTRRHRGLPGKIGMFLLVATLALSIAPAQTSSYAQATITVSGTVTGHGGPVEGVRLWISSTQTWREAITNASGFYSVSIPTDGQLWFEVRPDWAEGLAQSNLWRGDANTNVVQDFELRDGILLEVRLTGGGSPVPGELEMEVQSLVDRLPDHQWYRLDWDGATRHRAMLPPDVYYVTVHNPPSGYYDTTQTFDLRTSAVTADLPLNTTYVHPIPYEPPDATKISIGPPDGLGEAAVTGAPGACLPLARVLLVNLNSSHQAHTISEADGSFSARIYAPPGSAVMVKHGPASPRWHDLEVGLSEGVNPFPGTILNLSHIHSGEQYELPFAAVGAIDLYTDDPGNTLNYVSSAWAMTGTVGPVYVEGEWTRVLDGMYGGQAVPGLYLGGLNWTHPALGDLDADDDLDLLVGEQSGHLVLYRNEGSAASPNWRFETAEYAGVATDWWAYPALADVTGDGALDLFVGTGGSTVAIYYNDGTPSGPVWPESPDVVLAVGGNPAPALSDLDGDADLDLVVGHGGGTLLLFRNDGTPASPVWIKETDNYLGYDEGEWLQPAFLNLDGDADLDLLVGRCGNVVWYERGGSAADPTWTRHDADPIGYGGGSCANSPAVGDWSGDGLPDLAIGEHWGVLRFFLGDDVSGWSEQPFSFPFDLAGDSAPALADWDDDGDLDLLVGQAHGELRRYRNDGSSASPDWIPVGTLPSYPIGNEHPHAFPTFADIDGDNDYDLFVGEGGWQGPGAGGNIHYYRNDGDASTPDWVYVNNSFLGLDVGGWSTPVFVDINNDDDLDLFVGDEAGTLTYVENTGTATAPAWGTPVQPYADLHLGEYSAPSFLDVDEDGDLDMLVGLGHGSLAYVRNTGSASNPAWKLVATAHPGIDIGEQARPAAADLDGDDKPDLLLGDGDGGLNLYLYEGPGTPPGSSDSYLPGDLFQVEGTVRFYGPAITTTTDVEAITVYPGMHLMKLFDGEGQPVPARSYFLSSMLTPAGFPIQGGGRASIPLGAAMEVRDLHYAGGHAIEGSLAATAWLPEDLPPGIYRPTIWLQVTGVPTNTDWLAANVVRTTFEPQEAALPPVTVGTVTPPRLNWRLLMDDLIQGTRGAAARQDQGTVALTSQIVSQGAPYYAPPVDARTGEALTYRLEPFLPRISFTDRRMPTPPLLPFDLPGGQLCVQVEEPDGSQQDLGCEALAQSFNRTKTTRGGLDLNGGTVQMEDVYSLKAASDRFRVSFDQYGHHIVTMSGIVSDVWGNEYSGGGTYDVWVAHPLDMDPGVLPGTPLAVGDAFNPALQIYPRVPAQVELTVSLYPDSDPARKIVQTVGGMANSYGYFDGGEAGITLTEPGEYRVDLTAVYTETSGELYMGSMTWGGVVMTPEGDADLVAHGRRGLDSLEYIPNFWFISSELDIPAGAVSHSLNPYYNGDVLWTRMSDGPYGGDSLVLGASVQDPVGEVEAAIQARYQRAHPPLYAPGSFQDRVDVGELPLFISTRSGWPAALVPEDVDQMAYSYRSSQRPGVRVREVVAEDGESGGYWRLNTLYDDQLGVGVQGDQVNDYKFQYVGAVYRDLETGRNEYLGHGTGWIFIPDDDPTGSRAMPPFAGYGGWDSRGGPLLTLKGEAIHIFVLPTGTRPGAVLEVGDTFRFAGHLMPPLDSQVAVTVTAPSGLETQVEGQANSIGYYYDPDDDFIVDEPGLWSVDVQVWHEGQCSGGTVTCADNPSQPCPSGDVLGSDGGRYWFYAVPGDSLRLNVSAPTPGFLTFEGEVAPVVITGAVPPGLASAVVDYTISMPGYILEHSQVTPSGGTYQIVFDPVTLHEDYPNLDLVGRDIWRPGLADTFSIGLLLKGATGRGTTYRANTVTLQGEQVFVRNTPFVPEHAIFLPLALKGVGHR